MREKMRLHRDEQARQRQSENLAPPPNRSTLTVKAWREKHIPLRDYLMGGVMCTTSRWFVFGETGIGKTLWGMDLGGAVAAGKNFLNWTGQRKARVMYIDGELPMETFKERIELIAERYGDDIEFYGYNREDLGDDGLPPLNTDVGQGWIKREIEAIKPDLIIFDSLMCLLTGSMSDEEAWMPIRPFVRWLTSRRIAQIWLHHANDSGKSFGDKTREWEMDTVVALSRPLDENGEPDDGAFQLEFRKARLRTPKNADQFLPLVIRPGEEWEFGTARKKTMNGKDSHQRIMQKQYLAAYDRLATVVELTHGFDDRSVKKVKTDAIQDELKSRGFLQTDNKGGVTAADRKMLSRAKAELLSDVRLAEKDGLIWRP
jgi:RecA-family ATPase